MQFKNVSQLFSILQTSELQTLDLDSTEYRGIQVDVKRDDLLHPIISGNKWRKLKYLLLSIEAQGYKQVATMGGGYSNFAHVLSYICYLLGWQCDLTIRAFPEQPLTPTLIDCKYWGANIHYVNRESFRALRTKPPCLSADKFWIPEGGLHQLSILGMQEILMELNRQYDYIVVATATGTSIAGLIEGARCYQPKAKIIGVSVLNNAQQQRKDITQLIGNNDIDWTVIEGYEFGGFAKSKPKMNQFMNEFEQRFGIPLEPIYNAKSFFAVTDLISKGYFRNNTHILLIHCGGLQGAR